MSPILEVNVAAASETTISILYETQNNPWHLQFDG